MTRPTSGDMIEHSGVNATSPGNGTGVAPEAVQGTTQNISALTLALASAPPVPALRDIHQSAATSVAVSTFADVVKPFAAGRTISTALATSDFVQNNPRWARLVTSEAVSAAGVVAALVPGLRAASAAAALASVIRWDLVNAGVSAQAPTRPSGPPKRRFAASATMRVKKTATIAEFGDALRALRDEATMSLNDLVTYVDAANERGENIVGLSKTALSSACQGRRLFQTEQQVVHFVTACRAEADVDVWLAAWRCAKKNRGARAYGSGTAPATESQLVTEASATTEGGWWLSGPGDEIVHVIQIPVTRGQVRGAVAALAVLGLIASSASTPTIRAAGLAAVGVAAGVTLAGHPRGTAARGRPAAAA